MTHGMTIKEREHAFGVRGLKMCSPKLHKEYRQLKRENAMMRRWLKIYVQQLHCRLSDEIRAKMPGLFAGGKKGK